MEEISESKWCKRILTFEAWFWSIVFLPVTILVYVVRNKLCIVGSIIRMGFIPLCLYICYFTEFDAWSFVIVIIASVSGMMAWAHFIVEDSAYKNYMLSRKLWKWI